MGTAKKTILIVEDDSDLRRLYATALTLAGFNVSQVADGLEALRYLDGSTPPSLIVLDLGLPTVSGFVVRQEIAAQAHTCDIPIVIVTGAANVPDNLEVACLLRKPVTPDELVLTVRNCVPAGAPSVRS